MACMCGDTCCPSCGPAQSNSKCPMCGEWMSEGCIHFDEETGVLKPEYEAEMEASIKAEREAEDALYRDWQEEHRLAEEFFSREDESVRRNQKEGK